MNAIRARVPDIAAWVGLVLMVVPLYWFISSGLMAPLWAVVGLLIVWAAALVLALQVRRRMPWLVLAIPFALMIFWVLVMTAGERLLGWTP
jgi:hypothetical protein